jgi:glycosyltransferase involved in cell wall biosynthesis
MSKKISLIIPVFNEQDALIHFYSHVQKAVISLTDVIVEYIFVNDGSTDATLIQLLNLRKINKNITIIDLSRNFGKEAALLAGIIGSQGDAIIPIDVDLQDPPELLPKMIAKWREGNDVVLARRVNRDSDSILKRTTANFFYKLHNAISTVKIPENVGDFRLMDRRVVENFKKLPESCRFTKGLFAWIGYQPVYIDYSRASRSFGKTKFKGWKLFNFAIDGITSFSTAPLRALGILGFFVSLVSFVFAIYIAYRNIFFGINIPGYSSLIVSLALIGGLQLLGIGVLGEYLGRAYMESKNRPIFIIKDIYGGG